MPKINEEKRERWKAILKEQEISGLSRQAFCKNQNIPFSNFAYYQNIFRKQKHPNSTGTFSPVNVSKLSSPQEIRVVLPNGFQCLFPCNVEINQVKELVRTLLLC